MTKEGRVWLKSMAQWISQRETSIESSRLDIEYTEKQIKLMRKFIAANKAQMRLEQSQVVLQKKVIAKYIKENK